MVTKYVVIEFDSDEIDINFAKQAIEDLDFKWAKTVKIVW